MPASTVSIEAGSSLNSPAVIGSVVMTICSRIFAAAPVGPEGATASAAGVFAAYDRGWDKLPRTDNEIEITQAIIDRFN